MTEVLQSPSFPSSSPSLSCTHSPPTPAPFSPHAQTHGAAVPLFMEAQTQSFPSRLGALEEADEVTRHCYSSSTSSSSWLVRLENRAAERQLSLLALLVALLRKSIIACRSEREALAMEIGWPTNVRHVAHVTFDRFNGFLGLPVELEPEVPTRPPSASANVFGVSTESMQLSYDPRGNSVPTILLMMQKRLYEEGGLQAEGIFRINAENGQEDYVRDHLNRGTVPEGIDVHCLAGLIKAWFRELPDGVLDSLSPEQVMRCESDEDCFELVRLLPSTEAALLDWTVNLMADVAQQEHVNKMSARNIAMVFAPNMTKMADPLTALMYAVQVMNFLKTLIMKALQDREDSMVEPASASNLDPASDNEHRSPAHSCLVVANNDNDVIENAMSIEDLVLESPLYSNHESDTADGEYNHFATPADCEIPKGDGYFETLFEVDSSTHKFGASPGSSIQTDCRNLSEQQPLGGAITGQDEKTFEISNLRRISLTDERVEAWW